MVIRLREIAYYFFVRFPQTIIGKYITKNLIRVHWGRGLNNFGDCLQADTLKYYGLTPVYVTSLNDSDIIMAGSILQLVNSSYKGIILGTGGDKRKYEFPNARVVGVRGKLTLSCFAPKLEKCILGDCGMLAKLVYSEPVKPVYKLGILTHFVDISNENVTAIKKKYPNDVLVISPLGNPKTVIKQIKMCEHIISSSLHGLIIADCFGIPTMRWVDRSTMPDAEFYDYKFYDYYSSIGVEPSVISFDKDYSLEELIATTTLKPQDIIKNRIKDLNAKMLEIASLFKSK